MKHILTLALIVAILLPLKSQPLYRYTFQEPHMGTYFKIIMYADDRQKAIEIARAAYDSVSALNQVLSDYLPASEVSQLNNAPAGKNIAMSNSLYTAIDKSIELSKLTNGAFDITVGPVVKLWREARKENALPDKQDLTSALNAVGYENLLLNDSIVLKRKPGMQLDFGGIGKGMALSAAKEIINQAGVTRLLLDAGGDILLGDAPPDKNGWNVIVGLFEQEEKFQKELTLHNNAIASSGDLYQFVELEGKRYSHIVDPGTGLGITGQKRSTVIGPDAATADALASALCVMNTKDAKKLMKNMPDYEVLVFSASARGKIKFRLGKNILK